jgi:hypothetical protein
VVLSHLLWCLPSPSILRKCNNSNTGWIDCFVVWFKWCTSFIFYIYFRYQLELRWPFLDVDTFKILPLIWIHSSYHFPWNPFLPCQLVSKILWDAFYISFYPSSLWIPLSDIWAVRQFKSFISWLIFASTSMRAHMTKGNLLHGRNLLLDPSGPAR